MTNSGPDDWKKSKIVDLRTKRGLSEEDAKNQYRSGLVEAVVAQHIDASEIKKYETGPTMARYAWKAYSNDPDVVREAAEIARTLRGLRAVETAAILQTLDDRNATRHDPAFSLAVASAYNYGITTLINAVLIPVRAHGTNSHEPYIREYAHESDVMLERLLIQLSESPGEIIERAEAVASILALRRTPKTE